MREYSYDSLIRTFSFVFQRVYLFSDTIANNIRFGKPDASMEEVQAAAKKARCYDFIMALPNGFDTVLSEATSISAGQKQLLTIAREDQQTINAADDEATVSFFYTQLCA